MASKNEGVTKVIASFYWDDSGKLFIGRLMIYIPILYLPTFSESNAWDFHLVMTEISGNVPATSEDFRRISEDFRTLPKSNVPRLSPKTFEHSRSYLKDDTFSVLSYDFVRTQKRTHNVLRTICSDLWVWREKLSLMREQGRSQGGVLGCPWPSFCKPFLTKQPTTGGENAMTISCS